MNEGSEKPKPLLKDWRVRGVAITAAVIGFLIGLVVFGAPWHLPPAWGDIPSWISGISTVGLLIGAVITAKYAIKAFRKQTEEVAILAGQNQRDSSDRRKAQASRIFISVPSADARGDTVQPSVKNASDFPIYEAKFWYIGPGPTSLQPADPKDYLGTILPGHETHGWQHFASNEGLRHAIITFRDANNVYWIRMPGGVLEEQPARPERERVRAALQKLPTDLGPEGWAQLRGPSEDAPDARR